MAPFLFGVNIGEIHWSKFKSSYMWNTNYHLRRSKFVAYQLAIIFCVISDSLGTAVISDYRRQQDYIQSQHPGATEHNDDYIGIASFNIFCCTYVAFIFGSAFFLDLFFPERREDRGIRTAWRCCSLVAFLFILIDVIALTIVVNSRSAYITGVSNTDEVERLISKFTASPLRYQSNRQALVSLVFLCFGVPFVFTSAVIMWIALHRIESVGPFSTRARQEQEGKRLDIEATENTFELSLNGIIDGYRDEGRASWEGSTAESRHASFRLKTAKFVTPNDGHPKSARIHTVS